MTQQGDFINATLRLALVGPLFVGSGEILKKKEYFYPPRGATVFFLQPQKFQRLLVEKNLVDEYLRFMMEDQSKTLYEFCQDNKLTMELLQPTLRGKAAARDAIAAANNRPAQVALFMRDAQGRPYLPGSSVKGALRTVLLADLVQKKNPRTAKPVAPPKGEVPKTRTKMFRNEEAGNRLEAELLNTLALPDTAPTDMINSVFRGVSVSDSAPLSVDTILCRKVDFGTRGGSRAVNTIRECLPPGTQIKIPIRLDTRLSGGITIRDFENAIARFDQDYTKNVLSHFAETGARANPRLTSHIFLGGGSGFFDKTITAQWMRQEAPAYTSDLMQSLFSQGHHEHDKDGGISPHMLKYTRVNRGYLPFGLCAVDFI